MHAGVDLGETHEPVRAPTDLVIVRTGEASYADDEPRFSSPQGWAGYGPQWISAQDDAGFWHLFAHVSDTMVRPGERVAMGTPLALVARRGRHLHWEVRVAEQPPARRQIIEVAIDPLAWLEGRIRPWDPRVDGCPEGSDRSPLPCTGDTSPTPAQLRAGLWTASFERSQRAVWTQPQSVRVVRRRSSGGGGLAVAVLFGAAGLALGMLDERPRRKRKR